MNKIVCYNVNEKQLNLPGWNGGPIEDLGICQGRQFLSVPEDVLPQVPAQATELDYREATPDEVAALKKVSPAYLGLNNEVSTRIRERYSIAGEFRALRTDDQDYKVYVSEVLEAVNLKKQALGF